MSSLEVYRFKWVQMSSFEFLWVPLSSLDYFYLQTKPAHGPKLKTKLQNVFDHIRTLIGPNLFGIFNSYYNVTKLSVRYVLLLLGQTFLVSMWAQCWQSIFLSFPNKKMTFSFCNVRMKKCPTFLQLPSFPVLLQLTDHTIKPRWLSRYFSSKKHIYS